MVCEGVGGLSSLTHFPSSIMTTLTFQVVRLKRTSFCSNTKKRAVFEKIRKRQRLGRLKYEKGLFHHQAGSFFMISFPNCISL